jgi:hypothetical protein
VASTPTVRSAVIQATEQRLRPLELTDPLTPRVSAEHGAPKAPSAQAGAGSAGALDPQIRQSRAEGCHGPGVQGQWQLALRASFSDAANQSGPSRHRRPTHARRIV